jgi:hypothetical protein
MRKYLLIVLATLGIMLAVPEFATSAPIGPGALSAAADRVSTAEPVWHRRWHRPRYYRYRYRPYRVYRYRYYRPRYYYRRYW